MLAARPDVLNHNIESVPRLSAGAAAGGLPSVACAVETRPEFDGIATKSGLMLGLGEEAQEVRRSLQDLRAADCRILTLGQYLQPSRSTCRSSAT